MQRMFTWWYRISLPNREPGNTPEEREHLRYARLTSAFTLMILILNVVLLPLTLLKPFTPASSPIAIGCLMMVVMAALFAKVGWNIAAASFLVGSTTVQVVSTFITIPLDPSLVPVLDMLVISVALGGALMPPVSALVVGAINVVLILCIFYLQPHSTSYQQTTGRGMYSITIVVLPIVLQIIVSIVTYVIMRNLVNAIRRADNAEQIAALQEEIAVYEQTRAQEQEQISQGIFEIARVHAAIANGDLSARAPLAAENVLWQVAVPLNNLLNRVEQWKRNSDHLEQIQLIIRQALYELQQARGGRRVRFTPTGTIIDPLLLEMNYQQQSPQAQESIISSIVPSEGGVAQ